jgi:hypothetical protein
VDKEGGLVWDGCLASGFFNDGQHLFEFAEVLQHGYTSLCDCEDDSAFADGSFFNQTLFDEEVKVFFKDATVDVGFIHDVRQLQWSSVR